MQLANQGKDALKPRPLTALSQRVSQSGKLVREPHSCVWNHLTPNVLGYRAIRYLGYFLCPSGPCTKCSKARVPCELSSESSCAGCAIGRISCHIVSESKPGDRRETETKKLTAPRPGQVAEVALPARPTATSVSRESTTPSIIEVHNARPTRKRTIEEPEAGPSQEKRPKTTSKGKGKAGAILVPLPLPDEVRREDLRELRRLHRLMGECLDRL